MDTHSDVGCLSRSYPHRPCRRCFSQETIFSKCSRLISGVGFASRIKLGTKHILKFVLLMLHNQRNLYNLHPHSLPVLTFRRHTYSIFVIKNLFHSYTNTDFLNTYLEFETHVVVLIACVSYALDFFTLICKYVLKICFFICCCALTF